MRRRNLWDEETNGFEEPLSKRVRRLCRTDFTPEEISDILGVPATWVHTACHDERQGPGWQRNPTGHGDPEFNRKNARRYDLIERNVDGALTPEEAKEYQELQDWMAAYLSENCPMPFGGLAGLEKLTQRLEMQDLEEQEWQDNPAEMVAIKGFACEGCGNATALDYPMSQDDLAEHGYDIIYQDPTGVMISGYCPQCEEE